MKRLVRIGLYLLVLVSPIFAQGNKAWIKLTIEDAVKILNSSPWGQTQVDTDTSEMFFSPTKPGVGALEQDTLLPGRTREQQTRNNNRTDRGAINQAVSVNYYVRFFSSRPVREALARIVILNHPEPGPKLLNEMQGFVERDFGPYIVVTVTCGSPDGRYLGPAMQAFDSATGQTLKNNTYLERSDGKRVYLSDYRPPDSDGLGAKFVFPRYVDGEPFLISPKGSVRFVTEIGSAVKINVRFNLVNMIWKDRIEY